MVCYNVEQNPMKFVQSNTIETEEGVSFYDYNEWVCNGRSVIPEMVIAAYKKTNN